jgi:glucokinase
MSFDAPPPLATEVPGVAGEVEVVAAVDVGGTRIKAALVDRSLAVVARTTGPTPSDIGQDIGACVRACVNGLVAEVDGPTQHGNRGSRLRVLGCGVVVPGLVDESTGTGMLSVNLGWRGLPIRDAVETAVGVPTQVGHDVRAGLVAESRLGGAKGARNVLFMPVGTGIAGALMLDGSVISADGWAGELGHITIDPEGPPCPCGAVGCLEVIASAAAVAREYAVRSGRTVDAETVAHLASDGDPTASAVWDRAVAALAQAIATTVTITGVDLVLVGGGLAESGETLLAPLNRGVAERLSFQRPPRIAGAALGDQAGCLGAACLAWDAQ